MRIRCAPEPDPYSTTRQSPHAAGSAVSRTGAAAVADCSVTIEICSLDARAHSAGSPSSAARKSRSSRSIGPPLPGATRVPTFTLLLTPSSAVQVSGPTIAIGSMPLTCWKSRTRCCVSGPYAPSRLAALSLDQAAHDERWSGAPSPSVPLSPGFTVDEQLRPCLRTDLAVVGQAVLTLELEHELACRPVPYSPSRLAGASGSRPRATSASISTRAAGPVSPRSATSAGVRVGAAASLFALDPVARTRRAGPEWRRPDEATDPMSYVG